MTNTEVAQKAYDVVLAVMTAGEQTHEPGEWERQNVADHAQHLISHAEAPFWGAQRIGRGCAGEPAERRYAWSYGPDHVGARAVGRDNDEQIRLRSRRDTGSSASLPLA